MWLLLPAVPTAPLCALTCLPSDVCFLVCVFHWVLSQREWTDIREGAECWAGQVCWRPRRQGRQSLRLHGGEVGLGWAIGRAPLWFFKVIGRSQLLMNQWELSGWGEGGLAGERSILVSDDSDSGELGTRTSCAVPCSSHKPRVAIEHWKCGWFKLR